jgi:hypothetical protein
MAPLQGWEGVSAQPLSFIDFFLKSSIRASSVKSVFQKIPQPKAKKVRAQSIQSVF